MVSLLSLRHDADIPDGVSIHKHNYLLQYMYKDASWSIVDIINLITNVKMTLLPVSTVVVLHGASYMEGSHRVSLVMMVRRRRGGGR